jgi:hypothetical protein
MRAALGDGLQTRNSYLAGVTQCTMQTGKKWGITCNGYQKSVCKQIRVPAPPVKSELCLAVGQMTPHAGLCRVVACEC